MWFRRATETREAEVRPLTLGLYLAALKALGGQEDVDLATAPPEVVVAFLDTVLVDPPRTYRPGAAEEIAARLWSRIRETAGDALRYAKERQEALETAKGYFLDDGPDRGPSPIEAFIGTIPLDMFALIHDLPLSSLYLWSAAREVMDGWMKDNDKALATARTPD